MSQNTVDRTRHYIAAALAILTVLDQLLSRLHQVIDPAEETK